MPGVDRRGSPCGGPGEHVLWNTVDLGYPTVYASRAPSAGKLERGDGEREAGRLGKVEVRDDQVMLGAPFVFNKANIDQFDF